MISFLTPFSQIKFFAYNAKIITQIINISQQF